jgi:molybdenum cofactor cytidylyltransferase
MRDTGRIFAILMAAGFSKRFGAANKLLVPFNGKALARHTLDMVCGMDGLSGIMLVYADERVAALAAGLPVTLVRNAAPERGQRESARLGVEAADALLAGSGAEDAYYLFLPCDQPLLDPDTVRRILEARQKGRIVEPRYQGRPGSPSLFSGVFREELRTLAEGEQPRIIKARHPGALVPVAITNPLAFVDIDRPADLPAGY